ncbi:MAG: hypothetical protein ABWX63_10335 [Paeniglutamicibacter terrestris]|jgi:hypothetical protein|uniref:Integral membrane protein n=1 Tax=Paeniglutamicibacter terrestris TaxID=2723403 RepID=A0ABX1G8Y1_9MICC|nr:hypothetical protein [Paeniglutamicibacter terrestris]ASN38948.1 hypothetical protein CGQ24_07945 [Arthrobacter sp. 7749]NKG22463.1 hypothetical protein [Paeniglutamicibacter terrestris]
MTFLTAILVFLHVLGAAAIFGGWLANFKTPTVNIWQFYGSIAQLVTGLALVGVAEAGDGQVNHAKIAVKLLLAIGVFVAALLGRRKIKNGQEVPTGLAHGTGGTALIAIAVATLWV